MTETTTYKIYFCIADQVILNERNEQNKEEIFIENAPIIDSFQLNDTTLKTTLGYLSRVFFSLTMSLRYQTCRCMMKVYYKISKTFGRSRYHILSNDENKKLKEFNFTELYLIQVYATCNCELRQYSQYMKMNKFDIIVNLKDLDIQNKINIKRLKELEKSNETKKLENEKLIQEITQLKKEMEKLKKTDELNDFKNQKFEDFYDIVIDINSIKNVNKEGWKVKFNEKGLERYKKYKNEDLITIGVIGNNNKGKSFLLSKISKIKLLTGTSIHTQGLSVKYPKLKEHLGRQIIFLDSAGLETPVLRKINIRNKEKDNEIINSKEKEENEELNENQIEYDPEQNEEAKESQNKIKIEPNQDLNIKLSDEEIEQNKEFKENAKDKIMTELFLENLIINNSDILLVVVGKLTYSEQLLINKIKVECQKQNKGRIFIIHNLQEFRLVEQVKNYIDDILLKCSTFNLKKRIWITNKKEHINNVKEKEKNDEIYDINNENIESSEIHINKNINYEINNDKSQRIEDKNEIKSENYNSQENEEFDESEEEKQKLTKIYFSETLKYGDKKIEIYHLILANEDSEAGKYYNQQTYNFIENAYNLISEPKKFDVFEQVKRNFKNLSSTFLNNKFEEVSFTDNKKILEDKIIKLNLKESLSFKKCYIDELGFSLFKTGNFDPKYNYFKPDENTLEIRLEVPGNTKCEVNHTIEGKYTIINIKGEKKKDKTPEKLEDNLVNIRDYNKFELNIPLNIEDFQIQKLKDNYPQFKNGVCFIQYELASKISDKSAEPDDEI